MSIRSIIRRTLLRCSLRIPPEQYERYIGRLCAFSYPRYFDETKSIFIHVPKAAGTSVSMALYGREIGHDSWHKWYLRNPRKFNRYFKFAVIRDPIARFASAFNFLKAGGGRGDKEFSNTVLKEFNDANELAIALIDYHLQGQILSWWHFRPQAEFVADEQGRSKMNFLLRHENLEAGFKHVVESLGCAPLALPHLNRTKNQPALVLEKDAQDVLRCLYRKDFVLWDKSA